MAVKYVQNTLSASAWGWGEEIHRTKNVPCVVIVECISTFLLIPDYV
jgi:hypothetical protein